MAGSFNLKRNTSEQLLNISLHFGKQIWNDDGPELQNNHLLFVIPEMNSATNQNLNENWIGIDKHTEIDRR